MTVLKIIENKLKKSLVPGRTLVYFASGSAIRESYKTLPYENVILVDNALRRVHNGIRTTIPNLLVKDGIICLGMDCIQAVQLLKNIDWKIDCFVSINEGLAEGGGYFPINSGIFLGFAFSILSDTFIHIGYKEYYSGQEYYHLRNHWLDIPYEEKRVLKNIDPGYISPGIFTNNKKYADNAEVTLLRKKSTKQHSIVKNGKKFTVKHSSIWNEVESLDAAFVRFENKRQKDIILKVQQSAQSTDLNIYPIQAKNKSERYTTYNLDAILALSISNKWEHIGLIPSRNDYKRFIDKVADSRTEYPKQITIYHLNKDDFIDLYAL